MISEGVLILIIILLAAVLVVVLPGMYLTWRGLSENRDMSKRIDELEKGRRNDHLEITRLHTELARVGIRQEQWVTYARQLAAIMDEAGMHVPLSPDELAEQASQAAQKVRPDDAHYDKAALLRRMARAFNIDELHSLAFQMDVQTGNLAGETFEARAAALIGYCDRRGKLAELVALCRQLRPNGGI